MCNAVLHWLPEHPDLLRRWLAALPPRAWLAMQVPGNFSAPSHALARELAEQSPWRGRVDLQPADAVLPPQGYAELVSACRAEADVWETTYLQRMTGDAPVLEWLSGSALRPAATCLPAAEWERFRAELAPRLREAYPQGADGVTWFPFRRIFAVARVGST